MESKETFVDQSNNDPLNESKVKSLTVKEKLKLINLVESGKSVKLISEEFGVNRNTLHYIIKHKDKYKEKEKEDPHGIVGLKRLRDIKCPQLDQKVLKFMNESKANGEKVSGVDIKSFALSVASQLELEEFAASNGWLCCFLKRHKIKISEFNEDSSKKNCSTFKIVTSKQALQQQQIAAIESIVEDHPIENEEIIEEIFYDECCRFCGNNAESTKLLDSNLLQIVTSLLDKTIEIPRACNNCVLELRDIEQIVSRWRETDHFFTNLEIHEKTEKHIFDSEEIVEEEMIEEKLEDYIIEEDSSDPVAETEEIVTTISEPHSDLSKSPSQFKCHMCGQIFVKMYELSLHTRKLHGCLPKVACNECGKNYSSWEGLQKHRKSHEDQDKPFACVECGKSFSTRTGLLIHNKHVDHQVRVFTCDICRKVFKSAQILKLHSRVHLPENEKFCCECDICGKKVTNKSSLKNHIDSIHNGVKTCFCNICGKAFGNRSNLRSHLICHTTENVECDVCGKIFKNRISLQTHKQNIHKITSRNLSCEECGKSFKHKFHLERHKLTHSSNSFQCPYCTDKFKYKRELTSHISSVHEDPLNEKSDNDEVLQTTEYEIVYDDEYQSQ